MVLQLTQLGLQSMHYPLNITQQCLEYHIYFMVEGQRDLWFLPYVGIELRSTKNTLSESHEQQNPLFSDLMNLWQNSH